MSENNDLKWSDPEVIDALKSGNAAEFADLVVTYQERLIIAACSILDSPEDAEEAVQDSFLKAYHALEDFRNESHIFTWLYRITLNQAKNRQLQLKKEFKLQSLQKLINTVDSSCLHIPVSQQPHNMFYDQEIDCILKKIIAQLPRAMRSCAELRFINEYGYEEIAKIVKCPPGTVKSRLARARNRIKASAKKYQKEL